MLNAALLLIFHHFSQKNNAMKKIFFLTIIIALLSSCSTSRSFNGGMFQKRKYTKGFYINKKSNVSSAFDNKKVIPEKIIKEVKQKKTDYLKTIQPTPLSGKTTVQNTDSVKIILKSGEEYVGKTIEEDESGYSLQLKSGRVIYLTKASIFEVVTLKTVTTENKIQKLKVENSNKNTEHFERKSEKKEVFSKNRDKVTSIPSTSKSAIIFGVVALFTLVVPAIHIAFSGIAFIVGLILSFVGNKEAKKSPFEYNIKRAKAIKWIYLAPIIILLSLTTLAIILLLII